MKVTEKVTMMEYDRICPTRLPNKIPDWKNQNKKRKLGDCIYNFSGSVVEQREGVHRASNIKRDLSGEFALLSAHFWYFGDQAVDLPKGLRPIAQNMQGHRCRLNEPFMDAFVQWIGERMEPPGAIIGAPVLDLFRRKELSRRCVRSCAADRAKDEDLEEESAAPCAGVKADASSSRISRTSP